MILLGIFAISMIALNAYIIYSLYKLHVDVLAMFDLLVQENAAIKQKLSLAIRPKKEEKWENMREAFSVTPPSKKVAE